MNRGLKSLGLFLLFAVIAMTGRHLGLLHHTTTTTTSTTTSTTSSTTTTAAVTPCQGGDFRSVDNGGQGAAGTVYDSATLTKFTVGTCVVDGYPMLTLQDSSGAVAPSKTVDAPVGGSDFPTTAANAAPQQLVVTEGTSLRFDYSYSDHASTLCYSVATINVQVAANGSSTPVSLQFPASVCSAVTVSAFYLNPGSVAAG